ncbi:MAG: cation:proton antiporter family protein [Granulosicoccaceae bacterium]
MEALVLVFAFFAGLLSRKAGYPPLIGYLVAGFIANGLQIGNADFFLPIANMGVLLLLFTIGLKLNPRTLLPVYVWGAALAHMVIVVPLTAAVILIVGLLYVPLSFDNNYAAWTLAFALSFSSTVFAVKMFEERGDSSSFYSVIAIGVLVVQDVLAVAYLVLASGHYPSPWAMCLFALPVLKPLVARLLKNVGHGELLLFCGIVFAVATAELFEFLQLKGGLGALLAGVLFSSADRIKSKELYEKLINIKNLLLIGFFLHIGYYGFPSIEMLLVAVVLAALILLRPVIYFSLFSLNNLRARTSWLSALALANYSEFGLIVAATAVQTGLLPTEWVTTLAVAMSVTFLMATPVNKQAFDLYRRFYSRLNRYEKSKRLPEEAIGSLGNAEVFVLGMGRVGRGAYEHLQENGHHVMGIEEGYISTQRLIEQGYECVHGDATDRDFWERTGLANRDLLLVSLSNHRENIEVIKLAKELGHKGRLSVAARFPDQKEELEKLGCRAYYLYEDVGREFALHMLEEPDTANSTST